MEDLKKLNETEREVYRDLLKGQTAVVTGANSGIGKGVALALGQAGAQVVVNYVVDPEAAEGVAHSIEQNGGKAIAVKGDVSKEADVQEMFKQTIGHFGTVDILINNAGLQRDANLVDMTLEQWEFVLRVNLTGQFLCAREAVREFLRRGVVMERSVACGKIVCMSSVHDIIPWATHCNYAASKGGVLMFMKSVAQELAPKKIRCNAISPGAIKTPINQQAWFTADAEEKLLELIPYKRVGVTEDIGRAAVWLSSDLSDYINGITIYVDGGMTNYPGFATGG
ncbi:MAG: SDR family oxidoreductase [Leptospirales bacterium]|nr:SDR family oxidoreductase [Leptospirales bacterium]